MTKDIFTDMGADIRAFIFDLDGVLTDTAEFHFRAWKRLADEEGIPFTTEENDHMRGLSRRDSLTVLLKGRPIDDAQAHEWMERKNNYYLASLSGITPDDLLPGVRDFLQAAKETGLLIAVASASRNARFVLDKLQILPLFDAVGDGYSVVHSKPAPDLFLWTAGRLNVNPRSAIVFEDAAAGVQGAKAGGFWVVGLGDAVGEQADVSLRSLEGQTPPNVIAML